MSAAENPTTGRERRDRGCALTAERNPAGILQTQIDLLRAIRDHGDAISDDAPLRSKHPRRGPLRATAVVGLWKRGVTAPISERRTSPCQRRAGSNPVWTATDRTKLPALISELEQQLKTVVESQPTVVTEPE